MTLEHASDSNAPLDKPQAIPEANEGAMSYFWRSAVDAAFQKPAQALTQLYDHVALTNHADAIHLVDAAAAPKTSMEEHAKLIGAALGSLVPIGISALTARFGLGKFISENPSSMLLARGSLGLNMVESGATGFLSQGLFSPTADAAHKSLGDLLIDRSVEAGLGAASFTAMSAINHGLTSETAANALSRVWLSKLSTNPLLSGITSGIPIGFVNAELDARVKEHRWATSDEVFGSIYQMSLTGGLFGGVNWAARSLKSDSALAAPPNTVPRLSPQETESKIVSLYDHFQSNESGMVAQHKRQRAVQDAIEQIHEEDRYPVWQSLLKKAQGDSEYASLGDAVARSIGRLPEQDRLSAWNELDANKDMRDSSALLIAVEHLPEDTRLPAIEHLLDSDQGHLDIRGQIPYLPASALPQLAQRFFKMPQSENDYLSRTAPLIAMANWTHDMYELKVHERAPIVEKVLNAGFTHGKFGDQQVLNEMWANLPEPPFDKSSGASATPVRDYLTRKLTDENLAKVAFSWADPALLGQFAKERPDLLRAIASQKLSPMSSAQIHQAEALIPIAISQKSLPDFIAKTLETKTIDLPDERNTVASELIKQMAAHADSTERSAAMDLAAETFLNGKGTTERANAYKIASFIGESDGQALDKQFLQPISDKLRSLDTPYADKLQLSGRLAALSHFFNSHYINFELPDLRLPRQEIPVEDSELPRVRQEIESDLQNPQAHERLFARLGAYFPPIFADYNKFGGMLGRPQHGIHKFPLHEHSLYVVDEVIKNPDFMKLQGKDRTNLLWAALMHDAGKQAGVSDPGHEWASANLSWGVLRSLGYPVERIQRIAGLISRHQETSYIPKVDVAGKLRDDPDRLDDLATFYRHPAAALQQKILNEADIRSIDHAHQYFTSEAADQIDQIAHLLWQRRAQLRANTVPILTSQLPSRFGLSLMKGPYALLAHVSNYLSGGDFLKLLSQIESPEYSISASLVTEGNRRFFGSAPSTLVALVAGPYENVSQAWRNNLGTGTRVNWDGHVNLVRKWAFGEDKYQKGNLLAADLDKRARQAGIEAPAGNLAALKQVQDTVARYDTLDELIAENGTGSPITRAVQSVIRALNEEDNEQANRDYNEVKLNSPTLVGIGINRDGQSVYLENMTDNQTLTKLLGGQEKPDWLITGTQAPPDAKVVAEAVWRQALARDLPLVVLDP